MSGVMFTVGTSNADAQVVADCEGFDSGMCYIEVGPSDVVVDFRDLRSIGTSPAEGWPSMVSSAGAVDVESAADVAASDRSKDPSVSSRSRR